MSEEKRSVITKDGFKTGFVTVSLSWLAGFQNPGLTFQSLLVHALALLAVRYLTRFQWISAILVYAMCTSLGALYTYILHDALYLYGFLLITLPSFIFALTVVSIFCSKKK